MKLPVRSTPPRRLRRTPGRVTACLGIGLALLGCDFGREAGLPGSRAPSYAASALDGGSFALEDLRGKVVLLNVWATWCAPCIREMPALEEVHREFGQRGLEVVGVSIDAASERDGVQRFLDRHGITFRILHDPSQSVVSAFRTVGVPETFLIDRSGTIVERFAGEFDPSAADVSARIEALLAESAS